MPQEPIIVSQISIRLDGTPVEERILSQLSSAVIDQHAYLPGMFCLTFFDRELTLLDHGPFDLTGQVTISAEDEDGTSYPLIEGEITALEPMFREGMIVELVVRGYDKSHRLFRETKSQAFLNKKDSDLASDIAASAGLSTEIETTSVIYDHIFQDNQSDLKFLTGRAWRIGYECFVQEGKLYFRKPPPAQNGIALTWGEDLVSFQPHMTLAEQVDEVIVRGWDPKEKRALVGRAQSGNLYPEIRESRDGASWASTFGSGKVIVVKQPVISQAEADALAAARLDELSGAFVVAEGEAFRRPDIKAGRAVELSGLGERMSGSYLVTSATHAFTPEGLKTSFTVRGARTGLFSDQMGSQDILERWPGVVTAIVTNSDDPKNWGRVKVKYPWLTDSAESDWVRLAGPGGGPKAGFIAIPEVGDEVLIAFEHGDFNRPFVLGGLWNGKDAIPPKTDTAPNGKRPAIRSWCSIEGHRITVYDSPDNKIEIITAGGIQIVLDDVNRKILIESTGEVEIKSSTNMNVKAGANLKIEATGNIDIQANGQVNVKGAVVNLN